MKRSRPRTSGFTLVELLVVITIIALLMGMIFPATKVVIERARQIKCASNLKSITTAIDNYGSAQDGRLPPGVASCIAPKRQYIVGGTQSGNVCQGPNWLLLLLRGLDEGQMADGLDECLRQKQDCWNVTDDVEHDAWNNVGRTTPLVLLCPSAPRMTLAERIRGSSSQTWGLEGLSKGNYAANFGMGTLADAIEYYPRNSQQAIFQKRIRQGPFRMSLVRDSLRSGRAVFELTNENNSRFKGAWKRGDKAGISKANIRDGLAQTIMVSEVIGFDSRSDGRGAWSSALMGGAMFTAKTLPNADGAFNQNNYDRIQLCEERKIARDDQLYCGRDNRSDGNVWAAARSGHPGGVNVANCAGGTRFRSDAISLEIWQALSTRYGDPRREGSLILD